VRRERREKVQCERKESEKRKKREERETEERGERENLPHTHAHKTLSLAPQPKVAMGWLRLAP